MSPRFQSISVTHAMSSSTDRLLSCGASVHCVFGVCIDGSLSGEDGNKPVTDCAHDRRRYCGNSFNIHFEIVFEILIINQIFTCKFQIPNICVQNGIVSSKLSSKFEVSNLLESLLSSKFKTSNLLKNLLIQWTCATSSMFVDFSHDLSSQHKLWRITHDSPNQPSRRR